ncbi:MAG: hypothetical protein JWO36_32 [Myxococcales bacterium]|nr:hypothetical protein [Myxococcales bacterium]
MHLTPDGNVDRVRQRFENRRAVTEIPGGMQSAMRVLKESSIMKKLALGLLVVAAVACAGCSKTANPIIIVDSSTGGGSDSSVDACNVLAQTGCATNEKCSWIHDATTPLPLGHVGCAPNGTVAVGAACMYGPDGANGFDNCAGGLVCQGGTCKTICDPAGVSPNCPATFNCGTYEGLFGPAGQTVSAGVCDPSCDAIADNDFDGSAGSNVPSGSACPDTGSQTIGCYGYPSSTHPSRWSCTRQVPANGNIVHRDLCTTANGCANSAGNAYLNGCAQGYIPLLKDMTGGTGVVCIAICRPGNTYMGNTAAQAPDGIAPNRCRLGDRRGTFNTATTTLNGDHCMFSWLFEIDAMGNFVRSPTSDTVGFCLDHSKYQYDTNNDMVPDTNWPLCSSLRDGMGSGGSNVAAADFGCVNTMHAGLPFSGKTQIHRPVMEMPRMLYHPMLQQ